MWWENHSVLGWHWTHGDLHHQPPKCWDLGLHCYIGILFVLKSLPLCLCLTVPVCLSLCLCLCWGQRLSGIHDLIFHNTQCLIVCHGICQTIWTAIFQGFSYLHPSSSIGALYYRHTTPHGLSFTGETGFGKLGYGLPYMCHLSIILKHDSKVYIKGYSCIKYPSTEWRYLLCCFVECWSCYPRTIQLSYLPSLTCLLMSHLAFFASLKHAGLFISQNCLDENKKTK